MFKKAKYSLSFVVGQGRSFFSVFTYGNFLRSTISSGAVHCGYTGSPFLLSNQLYTSEQNYIPNKMNNGLDILSLGMVLFI